MEDHNNNYLDHLKEKIINKSITVGVIGLGYVGLPLSLSICEKNIKVIGFDINETYLEKLNRGESYIHHIPSSRLFNQISRGYLKGTIDYEMIKETNIIIICVPTPLNKYKEPDLSYINATMKSIKPFLKKGQILILESTTYPGTTEERIKPILLDKGFTIGDNIFLVYSPEREDPGNKLFKSEHIPKVLGGCTDKCTSLGKLFYESITQNVFTMSSTKAAEMTKLVENIHRAVNIGLMNELKILSDSLGIDIYEVIRAASTKPFGFTPFYPGPGLGGHCIPIDPFYLSWKAKEYDMNLRFIELAGEINSSMPEFIVKKIFDYFNNQCKSIKNSNIIILGLSYKKNVDDLRESPALKIADILINLGANLSYNDPFFKRLPKLRKYNFVMKSIEITESNLKKSDCLILVTDHDNYDYNFIKENSKFIVDTRGKFEVTKNIIRG